VSPLLSLFPTSLLSIHALAATSGPVADAVQALYITARIVAVVVGLFTAGSTFISATKTVVVPRPTSQRITRSTFVLTRRMFEIVAHEDRPFEERDALFAVMAPLAFVLLPFVWVFFTIAGFTAVQWGVTGGSLRQAFLISGSSMLTLGVKFSQGLPQAIFSFAQAALGLILVALLISYLPTIYSAFSRREMLVGRLESRAGIPPSPFVMLRRFHQINALHVIEDDLFEPWEQWFVELEESHSSFISLAFFRSPRAERSWITASGAVLDTCSLYLSSVDLAFSPKAALCLRSGYLSLRRVAVLFGLPINEDPLSTDPISVTREEFDVVLAELSEAGVPVKPDRDQAWRDFAGWRVNYDEALVLISKMIVAPPGVWSSDRVGPRYVPKMWPRKGQPRSRIHNGGRFG
jgi:hypothetical protein